MSQEDSVRNFCANIQESSFGGQLASVTWNQKERLVFVLGRKLFSFNQVGLEAKELNVELVWGPALDNATMNWAGRQALQGFYLISGSEEKAALFLLVDDRGVMVAQKKEKDEVTGGNATQTLLSEAARASPPMGVVHDSQKTGLVNAWALEYDKPTHQTVIYKLKFDPEHGHVPLNKLSRAESGHQLVISNGQLVLYPDDDESESGEGGGAPKRGSPFGAAPRGAVHAARKMLFLLDDDKGCVYAVHGWSSEINLLKQKSGNKVRKFKVEGTPYETFFRKCAGQGMVVDENLRVDRCNVNVPLVQGRTRSRGLLGFGGGGAGSYLLMAVGAFLLLLLGLFVYKRAKSGGGDASKKNSGKSGKGQKSLKQQTSSTLKGSTASVAASSSGKTLQSSGKI